MVLRIEYGSRLPVASVGSITCGRADVPRCLVALPGKRRQGQHCLVVNLSLEIYLVALCTGCRNRLVRFISKENTWQCSPPEG